jgi:hypothetical protein
MRAEVSFVARREILSYSSRSRLSSGSFFNFYLGDMSARAG